MPSSSLRQCIPLDAEYLVDTVAWYLKPPSISLQPLRVTLWPTPKMTNYKISRHRRATPPTTTINKNGTKSSVPSKRSQQQQQQRQRHPMAYRIVRRTKLARFVFSLGGSSHIFSPLLWPSSAPRERPPRACQRPRSPATKAKAKAKKGEEVTHDRR